MKSAACESQIANRTRKIRVDAAILGGASAGWQGLLTGGNLNNGDNAGPTYLNANNSGRWNRNANIGRQEAAFKKNAVNTASTLPLGKKGFSGNAY